MAKGKGFGKNEPQKRQRKITPRVSIDFEKFVDKHLGENWSFGCTFDTFDNGFDKYIRLTIPKDRHQDFPPERCEQLHRIASEFGLSGFQILLSKLSRTALRELKLSLTNRGGKA